MRYIVKYRKPGQVEGERLFDIPADADLEAVHKAAAEVAGPGATLVHVRANDGTVPYEVHKA